MSEDRVRIAVEDHVAEVALVRGEKHNALDGDTFLELTAGAERLASEPGLRAVVIYGEGPSFCSGIDVGWLAGAAEQFSEHAGQRDPAGANLFQQMATSWAGVPVPVIASIHGNCFGGGLQIALGGDIRIAAPDAKLSIREIHWGLVPDMGITATLPRLLALDVAKELTFTGRIVTGEEANGLGLVTRTASDPLEASRALAAEIASRSPDAVRAAKQLFDRCWPGAGPEALFLESELQSELIGKPNQLAAVISGVNGTPASFTDPPARPAGA
ncbi:MAG: crotonase/enoyl-CoA hydratase family protein [Solirubrobacterales bacterium]